MLENHRKGYATMSSDLKAYSIEDESLDTCKRYCMGTDVVVEMIPVHRGFSITFLWYKPFVWFDFSRHGCNIFWLHWLSLKEYRHKTGKIVYRRTGNS